MSSKNAYHLINPLIIGSQNKIVHARNPRKAGKLIYNQLSEYFTNHMEEFFITVMNVETKDLNHFRIKEKRNDNAVDFFMEVLPGKMSSEVESALIKKTTEIGKAHKQSGGKPRHKSDSDDSSDSSSDSSDGAIYITPFPITKFIYFYLPYYKLIGISPTDFTKVFMPTISLPLSPVIEMNFDIYKL